MLPASMATEPLQQAAGITALVAAANTAGDRLVIGKVRRMKLEANPEVSYYLYMPKQLQQPARFFVTVHGISRNAREHAKRFAPHAEQAGVMLIAPIFKRKVFPGYQRLATTETGQRPDAALDQIVAEVRQLTGLPQSKLYLFGFSGGGQFIHRYLMRHPERIAAAVVGAAGWYTFPDPKVKYPRGLKSDGNPARSLSDHRFLQVPVTVLVGDQDTLRDAALNASRRLDRQQGENRLQRGRRWIEAMRSAARAEGLETDYRFIEMPGVGHDFSEAMRTGDMGELVFYRLFDTPPESGCRNDSTSPKLFTAYQTQTEVRP